MDKTPRNSLVENYLSQFPQRKPTSKGMELKIMVSEMLMDRSKEAEMARKAIKEIAYITLATALFRKYPFLNTFKTF